MKELESRRGTVPSTSLSPTGRPSSTTIIPCWMRLRRHQYDGAPFFPNKRRPGKMQQACTVCGQKHTAGEVLPPE